MPPDVWRIVKEALQVETPGDHRECLIGEPLLGSGLTVAAPPHPGSEDRPAHYRGCDLRSNRPTVRPLRRRSYPSQQHLVDLTRYLRLDERPELPVGGSATRFESRKEVARRQEQCPQALLVEPGPLRQPSLQLLSEGLAHEVVQELELVAEVVVEGGPVHRRPLGYLLHGQPAVALLRHQLAEGPHYEPAGALDAGILPLLLCRLRGSFNQHLRPFVV